MTRTTPIIVGMTLACLAGMSHAQPVEAIDVGHGAEIRRSPVPERHPIEFETHPEDEDVLSRIDATFDEYEQAVDDAAFYGACARRDDEHGRTCARERDAARARIAPLRERMVVLERLRADRATARVQARGEMEVSGR